MKEIKTKKVAKDFAHSSRVILERTPETVLLFKPEIHPGGVRGRIIRFKKDHKGEWGKLTESDFKKVDLPVGSKIEIELPTEALSSLLESVEIRREIVKQGIKSGEKSYIVADKDNVVVVDDKTKREIFEKILKKGYSDELWQLLRESEPELATRLSVGHIHAEKQKTVKELRSRLGQKFPETKGKDSWQRWIYENNWVFGVNYVEVIEKARISISGCIPDYLFLAADGFVDILEIKLPEEEVILEDSNHTGSYKWSAKSNEAIGQVVTYINEVDRFQLDLKKEIKRVYGSEVSFVKPRSFILIGNKTGWDEFKREALRKLNFALHGIEILTYSDLLRRAERITQTYKEEEQAKRESLII